MMAVCLVIMAAQALKAQNFDSVMVLDGLDRLVSYGIDTSGHWWAVTEPFTNRYRMVINGKEGNVYSELTEPVFSPNSTDWSHFAYENGNVYLIDNERDSLLEATDYGEIAYSANGMYRAYSCFQAEMEVLKLPFRTIKVENRVGKLFIDNTGMQFAIVLQRLNLFILNVNGKETTTYDEIKPIGFWHNGDFIYAARNGNVWEVFKGKERIGDSYENVSEALVNRDGTVFAMIVKYFSNLYSIITYSDEYREPSISKTYDFIWDLALHPKDILVGAAASSGLNKYVLQNSAEYYAPGEFATPFYSYDGDELIFIGRNDYNTYISINGRLIDFNIDFNIANTVARKPKSSTIAYCTGTTLLVYYYEKNEFYTGYMTDKMGKSAIWNWRDNQYQALGETYNRLYLITCKP